MKDKNSKEIALIDKRTGTLKEITTTKEKWIGPTELMTKDGGIATYDENMLNWACENLGRETLTLIKNDESKDGPNEIQCAPGDAVFVAHSYYTIFTMSGKPISVKKYLGKELHKRLRLK